MNRRQLLSLALLPLVEEPVRRVYSFFNNPLWKPLAFGVFELADHEGHKRIIEVEMQPDDAGVWRGKLPIDLGKDLGTAYPPHGAFVFHGIDATRLHQKHPLLIPVLGCLHESLDGPRNLFFPSSNSSRREVMTGDNVTFSLFQPRVIVRGNKPYAEELANDPKFTINPSLRSFDV